MGSCPDPGLPCTWSGGLSAAPSNSFASGLRLLTRSFLKLLCSPRRSHSFSLFSLSTSLRLCLAFSFPFAPPTARTWAANSPFPCPGCSGSCSCWLDCRCPRTMPHLVSHPPDSRGGSGCQSHSQPTAPRRGSHCRHRQGVCPESRSCGRPTVPRL